ncbi:MAG: hypothetical protein IPK99_01445 [Flavobacteriales bacterium]|nr:hypothetical protein [Flavobacteriales bacterium]
MLPGTAAWVGYDRYDDHRYSYDADNRITQVRTCALILPRECLINSFEVSKLQG